MNGYVCIVMYVCMVIYGFVRSFLMIMIKIMTKVSFARSTFHDGLF